MIRHVLLAMAVLAMAVAFVGDGNAGAQGAEVRVVVSLPDMEPVVRDVGGRHVEVSSILPPGSDPHGFTVTQEVMADIADADILVLANSDLLGFEGDVVENFPDIERLDFPDYEAEGATLDPFPGYDRNEHGYWLKIDNARAIARGFAAAISRIDPDNADEYAHNLDAFSGRLDRASDDLDLLSDHHGLRGKKVVAAVPGVAYIVQNMRMDVGAILLAEGSGFVGGSAVLDVQKGLSSGEYIAIVCPESMREARAGEVSEQLSRDTGAPVIYVRFLSVEDSDDFLSQVYYNAGQLALASRAGGSSGAVDMSLAYAALGAMGALVFAEAFVIVRCRGAGSGEADQHLFGGDGRITASRGQVPGRVGSDGTSR
ncbi:MAG TPA: hypothetical protein EYP43_03505, partial [Thermoplasmata archaeon]|nr:hypothetical protein [Thermoplasmata archaeon]